MSVTINNCQKICLQLQVPVGTAPYTWTANNTNVSVLTGGSGFSAIVRGVTVGAAQVVVTDANGSVVTGFAFTIVSLTTTTTPVTSNTVLLAFFTTTVTGQNNTTGTFSGTGGTTISSLSTTGNGTRTCWFAGIGNPGGTLGYFSVFWNRASNTNAVQMVHTNTLGSLFVGLVGLGLTSNTPANNALDYQIPIVQFSSGSQASSFLTTLTLPFTLACSSTSNYIIFAQGGTQAFNTIVVSNFASGSSINLGWYQAVTTTNISYMIVARPIRNVNATSGVLYSDVSTFTINETFTVLNVTLDTPVTATPVFWFAQFSIASILGASQFQWRVSSAYQTTSTNLQIQILSSFAGTQTLNIQYVCFYKTPQTSNLQYVDA